MPDRVDTLSGMGEFRATGGACLTVLAYWGIIFISGGLLAARWAMHSAGVIGALTAVAAAMALSGWCGALGAVDLATRRLPNRLTLPGALLIVSGALAIGRGRAAVCGALLLGAVYLIAHLARPAAMGAGDVKLALGFGAATALGGGDAWVLAAIGAPLLTAAAGLTAQGISRARSHGRRRRTLGPAGHGREGPRITAAHGPAAVFAHGPSMCIASLVGLVLGG